MATALYVALGVIVLVALALATLAFRRHDRLLVRHPDTRGWTEPVDSRTAQDRVVNRILGAIGKSGHG